MGGDRTVYESLVVLHCLSSTLKISSEREFEIISRKGTETAQYLPQKTALSLTERTPVVLGNDSLRETASLVCSGSTIVDLVDLQTAVI